MRNLFASLVIAGAVLALSYASPAEGAESYLGTLYVTDAGFVHNQWPTDGGQFAIAPSSLLTIQPSANAYVCVDQKAAGTNSPSCTSSNGVLVSSGTAFPTSCAPPTNYQLPDAGLVSGVCLAMCAPASGTSVNCVVWQRKGNEF